ncbi:plasmid pRiA4b ORF-3 family protein [Sporosarcina sp. BP05]|uniref:plasmid pRiA4b ORF-3 family protein n=1 Tax=Sporosarcina sp. BP05 TaxID=2758726 RepID=UPI0016466CCB|nr:plasmid pRiA4b ORF-3 family protein [Sporosarcina sp. BP05]
MKAYILKLSFEGITPQIWRRIILPAGATFNRLHETIQNVTNFQSTLEPYHTFGVEIDDYFITDNESILDEYKGKAYYGKTVKQPARIKIDSYLEKHSHFIYNYDFGDDWRILVELEEIVEDYYFGYPSLLEGEGTAPPEDVGGPPGYEAFLKVYQDPTHPDYLSTYAWAEKQFYLLLDIAWLNERLRMVKYKKTEWQSIDHDNYYVLSDKYRGAQTVNIDELANKNLIIQYAIACTKLYGLIKYPKFLEIYNAQNKPSVSSSELQALLADSHYAKLLEKESVFAQKRALNHEAIEYVENYSAFIEGTIGKPFYVPAKEELLLYTDDLYYEKTSHQERLGKMLAKDFFGGSTLMIKDEIDKLVGQLRGVDVNFQAVVRDFLVRFECKDMKQMNEYMHVIAMIANSTRIWENRGHTPHELGQMGKRHLMPLPSTPFSIIEGGRTGRNEPCPCGSGKKHKKCCGK